MAIRKDHGGQRSMGETWGLMGGGDGDPIDGYRRTSEYSPFSSHKSNVTNKAKKQKRSDNPFVYEAGRFKCEKEEFNAHKASKRHSAWRRKPCKTERDELDLDDAASKLSERFGGHVSRDGRVNHDGD